MLMSWHDDHNMTTNKITNLTASDKKGATFIYLQKF